MEGSRDPRSQRPGMPPKDMMVSCVRLLVAIFPNSANKGFHLKLIETPYYSPWFSARI